MAYQKLITAPDIEPISLAVAKQNLRVDFDEDNDKIIRHIKEAREWVEQRVQQKIAEAVWEIGLDRFPPTTIELAISPIQSVVSLKYDDVSNVEQTLVLTTNYTYANGIITPVTGSWPSTSSVSNPVRIQVRAGYNDSSLIPNPLLAAIHLKIRELYDGGDASMAIHNLLTNYYKMVA